MRALRHAPTALAELRALPEVPVDLAPDAAGKLILTRFNARTLGITRPRAVSVLTLPQDGRSYLRGRSRQALRTNCNKARALGVSVEPIGYPQLASCADQLRATDTTMKYLDDLVSLGPIPGARFRIARSATGAPLAISCVVVSASTGWLRYMMTVDGPDGSLARYLTSAETFVDLADEGVRQVIVEGAVRLSPGLIYFQQRLGFELARLRIRVT